MMKREISKIFTFLLIIIVLCFRGSFVEAESNGHGARVATNTTPVPSASASNSPVPSATPSPSPTVNACCNSYYGSDGGYDENTEQLCENCVNDIKNGTTSDEQSVCCGGFYNCVSTLTTCGTSPTQTPSPTTTPTDTVNPTASTMPTKANGTVDDGGSSVGVVGNSGDGSPGGGPAPTPTKTPTPTPTDLTANPGEHLACIVNLESGANGAYICDSVPNSPGAENISTCSNNSNCNTPACVLKRRGDAAVCQPVPGHTEKSSCRGDEDCLSKRCDGFKCTSSTVLQPGDCNLNYLGDPDLEDSCADAPVCINGTCHAISKDDPSEFSDQDYQRCFGKSDGKTCGQTECIIHKPKYGPLQYLCETRYDNTGTPYSPTKPCSSGSECTYNACIEKEFTTGDGKESSTYTCDSFLRGIGDTRQDECNPDSTDGTQACIHNVCDNGMCIEEKGGGRTECEELGKPCVPSQPSQSSHGVCKKNNNGHYTCEKEPGDGPSECQESENCYSHNTCSPISWFCKTLEGPGANECLFGANEKCQYNRCMPKSNGSIGGVCQRIYGPGYSDCSFDNGDRGDSQSPTCKVKHTVCVKKPTTGTGSNNGFMCVFTDGPGGDECSPTKQCVRASSKVGKIYPINLDAKKENTSKMITENFSKESGLPVAKTNSSQNSSLTPSKKGVKINPIGLDPESGENADLTLMVTNDFGCPFSAHANPFLISLKDKFNGKVGLIRIGLPNHPGSINAELGYQCALKQNKGQEMASLLFANSSTRDADGITHLVEGMKLDTSAFTQCLKDPTTKDTIMTVARSAQMSGLNGTPIFIVEGEEYDGMASEELMMSMIQKKLDKKGSHSKKKTSPKRSTPTEY